MLKYTGSHQRALRKGSQLVLTLARAPPEDEKEKQQRLMRVRRVVSIRSGLRLALLKPAALPVTPLPDPPLSLLLLLKCNLCLVFVILSKLFIVWQRSLIASWCTLCVGMPKFSKGVMVY